MSGQLGVHQVVQAPAFSAVAPVSDVYANQLRMGATLTDFTLTFGSTEDNGPRGATSRDRVIIRLAPGTAKILQANLAAAIAAFEEAVGPIPQPLNTSSQLDALKAQLITAFRQQMDGVLVSPVKGEP